MALSDKSGMIYPLDKYPWKIRQGFIVQSGEWLNDDHIDEFGLLLDKISSSKFQPRMQYLIFYPELITPVPKNSKHIQLLFSCDNLRPTDADGRLQKIKGGHWVCSYYDGNTIYIYDSLNRQKVHAHHMLFLRALYPYYDFDQEGSVLFPLVDRQPNCNDCGVYSIAFAISIFCRSKPENVRYYQPIMRTHLLKIHFFQAIEHFPCHPIDPQIVSPLAQHVRDYYDNLVEEANRAIEIMSSDSSGSEPIIIINPCSEPLPTNMVPVKDHNGHLKVKSVRFADRRPKFNEKITVDGVEVLANRVQTSKNINPQNIKAGQSNLPDRLRSVKSPTATDRDISVTAPDFDRSSNEVISLERELEMKRKKAAKQAKWRAKKKLLANQPRISNVEKDGANTRYHQSEQMNTDSLNNETVVLMEQSQKAIEKSSKTSIVENVTASGVHVPSGSSSDITSSIHSSNIEVDSTLITSSEAEAHKKLRAAERQARCRAKRKQTSDNSSSESKRHKAYYEAHKNEILEKKKNRVAEKRENEKAIQEMMIYQKTALNRRIKKLNDRLETRYSKEWYTRNVWEGLEMPSPVSGRLEAERIVKWCFETRNTYTMRIKKLFENSKQVAEVSLTRDADFPSASPHEQVQALCGQSMHYASSEAYYAETCYQSFHQEQPIVMDVEGRAMNILPLTTTKTKKKKSWVCEPRCKTSNEYVLNKLRGFFQQLMSCPLRELDDYLVRAHECTNKVNPDKLGHSYGCYMNPTECLSTFLSLEILAPHFPSIRNLKRYIHDLMRFNDKLKVLDEALNNNDIATLLKIADEAQGKAERFKSDKVEINLNESEIRSKYNWAFRAFTKRVIDTPRFACISCEKLCIEKDIIDLDELRVLRYGNSFKAFQEVYQKFNLDPNAVQWICQYCDSKFRANKMPPTCIANNLYVRPVPPMIKNLNIYEKILIQRAKAFQVVQKLGTVAKKNQLQRHKIPKVVGRTFHLPLPMDETLKKVCPSTNPINAEHELYILVRGIPTKAKVIWEQLVDLKKVWQLLKWLQENNPLYSEINLPESHQNLLPDNLREVQYQDEQRDPENIVSDGDNVPSEHNEKKAALLTQMSQSDGYYERFSIYPIHEKKINKSATDLYQMLKVYDRPLNRTDQHLDLKCFPDLYPYGENGQTEKRLVPLSDFEYIKSRLMSKHSQFRLHDQYLFYLLHNNNLRQINAGIYHKLNITNPLSQYTAASCLDEMSRGLLESNLNTIFKRLRNTEQFWVIPRSNLSCMIRNYGPATWFLTFSPSEWLWGDLVEYLREVNNIPIDEKIDAMKLIVSDPVCTSRFIDIKFKAMLDFIRSPDNPIGEVEHYFWRREYQTRGAQHFHLLIWIKDAPIIGKSSPDEIATFILKYLTCRIPDKKISPELYRRVNAHQRHRHNDYCLRTKKTKTGFTRRCKFGHPRPLTDTLKLRDVSIAIAGRRKLKTKSRLYDLPRSSAEANINDYNPPIVCAWNGNMDLQFVGEESTLLTWYTTKYVSKSEKSNIPDPFDILNSTKSVSSCLWNLAMRMLNNRECGAFEAADSLLGIGLHGTDPQTTIKYVDVNPIRARRLKPRQAIADLPPESTDVFYDSLVDQFYPNRPDKLESINLYDFAKWYDVANTRPKTIEEVYKIGESKYLKRRSRGCLVNHRLYNIKTQPELYYYSILLLFQPWRKIEQLKGTSETYAEAFLSLHSQLTEAMRYHEKIIEIERAKEFVTEEVAKQLNSSEKADELCDDQILDCVPVEVEGAMKDFKDVAEKFEVDNLSEMITELNLDQKRIFDTVTDTLQSKDNILRMYVSGEGGTGKSFLIKTLRLWTKKVLNKSVAVTAPTGIAAFNVNGMTIHRLFQLPVEHGRTAKYRELSDSVLKLLRAELKDVVLIIIDEVSMISNVNFMYIHLRLTEIFDTGDSEDGWFGKKHIILLGDLLQLPPVHEEPPFMTLTKKKIDECIGAMGPVDLWSLFSYDELRINMRQKGDHSYRDMLSRIRIGVVLDSDSTILESRKLKFTATSIEDRLNEICDYMGNLPLDTVCLLPTCELCDILNAAMLSRISSPEIKLVARDTIECVHYMKKQVSKFLSGNDENNSRTAGLSRVITVKVGARIMIRRNIDVTLGLVNGTIATVISVRRTNNDVESINILLPSGVEHTLERMSVKFEVMDRAFVVRKQFPICLSYGMTIHKSQGLSLQNAIVDAGNSIFSCGQTYVALSRVTKLEGLHLINYDPGSVKANRSAIVEYNRLRKQYRPELETLNIVKVRGVKALDTVWSVSATILACQAKAQDNLPEDLLLDVRSIDNRDNVSCYAISSVQCIIHCCSIREAILIQSEKTSAIRSFVQAYTSANQDAPVDILQVRNFVGGIFTERIQQDAGEFINSLCERSCGIRNTVNHQISITTMCRSCGIETTYPANTNNILLLSLPTERRTSLSLQEIISDNVTNWKAVKICCNNCNASPMFQRTNITSTQRTVIIQLLLFHVTDGQVKKKTCAIKAIPNATIRINDFDYKVTSAIFHHGSNVENGHYTSMLRMKGSAWVSADDSRIRKCHWPRNGKNVYILFLELK